MISKDITSAYIEYITNAAICQYFCAGCSLCSGYLSIQKASVLQTAQKRRSVKIKFEKVFACVSGKYLCKLNCKRVEHALVAAVETVTDKPLQIVDGKGTR